MRLTRDASALLGLAAATLLIFFDLLTPVSFQNDSHLDKTVDPGSNPVQGSAEEAWNFGRWDLKFLRSCKILLHFLSIDEENIKIYMLNLMAIIFTLSFE